MTCKFCKSEIEIRRFGDNVQVYCPNISNKCSYPPWVEGKAKDVNKIIDDFKARFTGEL